MINIGNYKCNVSCSCIVKDLTLFRDVMKIKSMIGINLSLHTDFVNLNF